MSLGGVVSFEESGRLVKVKFTFPDFETPKKSWFNYYYKGGKITEHEAKENLFKIFCMDTNRTSYLTKDDYSRNEMV